MARRYEIVCQDSGIPSGKLPSLSMNLFLIAF